tara:strand:- start:320 stop:733 length:414 start_codon:yes stop_codon:yes gene_type:complete
MYAVLRSGGKQYRVAQDDVFEVEKLDADVGAKVALADVLMIGDGDAVTVGTPSVDGASVVAEVLDQVKGPKLLVFKKNRRKNYRRRQGHRQELTVLRVTEIKTSARKRRSSSKTGKAKKSTKKVDVDQTKTASQGGD